MNKNYHEWIILKSSINNTASRPAGYKDREIWWAYLGENIGVEEDGKGKNFSRPVLILRGFSKDLFWAIPLSTTDNRGPYYYEFTFKNKTSVALISQIRALDTSRLVRKYGFINKRDFKTLNKKIAKLLRF